MSAAVGGLNILLGLVYTSYGVMTFIELKQGWKTRGVSQFGLAWLAMAFTCGPHHFDHGVHTLIAGRHGGPLDLLAVGVGLPAGAAWFLLRLEALTGGRGDRFIDGTPDWVVAIPALSVGYLALLVAAFDTSRAGVSLSSPAVANLALVLIYMAIGWSLLHTQLTSRPNTAGWSLSGLSLTVVFPTCALMHGIYAFYIMTGRYQRDVHGMLIDWLAVPAGLYFLAVVRALSRGQLVDWKRDASDVTPVLAREI
jgi:hypothetical protein